MRKVFGISFSLSSFERGLWFDHDAKQYNPKGVGVKVDIVVGKMIRPIPKFWKRGFWKGDDEFNPWKGGDYWFIMRLPFMIGPFISIALWQLGFYLGFKTFVVEPKHSGLDRYGKWLKNTEAANGDDSSVFLQLSATTRTTRWK